MADRPANDIPAALLEYLDAQILNRTDDWTTVLTRTVESLVEAFDHYQWTGVYLVDDDMLALGPYVGLPTEHVRIAVGAGICGAAVAERATIIVDDVTQDARYLACSLTTKSEIVVPIIAGPRVVGEIDVDSDRPAAFGDADQAYLEEVAAFLARLAAPAEDAAVRHA